MARRDLDGLLEAAALDEVEPADRLLGLGKGAVRDARLPVADADGVGLPRRRQLVAGDPGAPRLELVQPGKALLVLRSVVRGGLGLASMVLPSQQTSSRYFIVAPS